jgi:Holliday junction resolvase RusA-like endonuclease
MIAFTVEGNPLPMPRPRTVTGRDGRMRTITATRKSGAREHKDRLAFAARRAGVAPRPGPVRMVMRFYRSSEQPCDLDNLAKTVLDALNGIAFHDDRQVAVLDLRKAVDRQRPRTEVEVSVIGEDLVEERPVPAEVAQRTDAERRRALRAVLPPEKRSRLVERLLRPSVRRPG